MDFSSQLCIGDLFPDYRKVTSIKLSVRKELTEIWKTTNSRPKVKKKKFKKTADQGSIFFAIN